MVLRITDGNASRNESDSESTIWDGGGVCCCTRLSMFINDAHAYCFSKMHTVSPGSELESRCEKFWVSRKSIFLPSSLNQGGGGRPGMDLQRTLNTCKQFDNACTIFSEYPSGAIGMACDAESADLHSLKQQTPRAAAAFVFALMASPLLGTWRSVPIHFPELQKHFHSLSALI